MTIIRYDYKHTSEYKAAILSMDEFLLGLGHQGYIEQLDVDIGYYKYLLAPDVKTVVGNLVDDGSSTVLPADVDYPDWLFEMSSEFIRYDAEANHEYVRSMISFLARDSGFGWKRMLVGRWYSYSVFIEFEDEMLALQFKLSI